MIKLQQLNLLKNDEQEKYSAAFPLEKKGHWLQAFLGNEPRKFPWELAAETS
jgi:hypothetical protein